LQKKGWFFTCIYLHYSIRDETESLNQIGRATTKPLVPSTLTR
jgi:hypothetical protein